MIKRWCFLVAMIFVGASAAHAQLGIFGSVPSPGMPTIRYVRLSSVINVDGEPVINIRIPVNGLSNYYFYYAGDGSHIPGGSYYVSYLGADGVTFYGYDTVNYVPNAGFTNGVKVRALNSGGPNQLGIYGIVTTPEIDNGDGSIGLPSPIQNATVILREFTGSSQIFAQTNRNGFYAVYYTNGSTQNFLPPVAFFGSFYEVTVFAQIGNCSYFDNSNQAVYVPSNTTNPGLTSFFVNNAQWEANVQFRESSKTCS